MFCRCYTTGTLPQRGRRWSTKRLVAGLKKVTLPYQAFQRPNPTSIPRFTIARGRQVGRTEALRMLGLLIARGGVRFPDLNT